MLQQTTVKAVAPYFARFVLRWPDVRALAAAPLSEILSAWAGLGYYARARNLHACAHAVVAGHGGRFPADEAALRKLPGIGAYTAAAIAAIAFDRHAAPVDGNIERVVARLFAVEERLPAAKAKIRALAATLVPARRPGDAVQALMDLGAAVCTRKRPACALCPFTTACAARRRGDAESFPRKAPRRNGALRRGLAFVALREDGRILLRTRPQTGLLGGMSEVPTSEWSGDVALRHARAQAPAFPSEKKLPGDTSIQSPPPQGGREHKKQRGRENGIDEQIRWRRLPGAVTHTFTHFPLELAVCRADLPRRTRAPAGTRWVSLDDLAREALPNVMRKVIAHALQHSSPARGRHK
jgi:A/G-specific adenine glycosylase